MSKSTLHLDLHPIAKNSKALEASLHELIETAVSKRVKRAEIIPGKGTGQLMKRVKRFLNQKHIKSQYKKVEVDANNNGRLFVIFR